MTMIISDTALSSANASVRRCVVVEVPWTVFFTELEYKEANDKLVNEHQPGKMMLLLRIREGLLAGCRIVKWMSEGVKRTISFLICHPSFDEIPLGYVFPVWERDIKPEKNEPTIPPYKQTPVLIPRNAPYKF